MKRSIATLITLLLCATLFAAADDKPSSQVTVTVVRESNGRPVRNASVIFHTVNKEGRQGKDAYQTKTGPDGSASLSGLDYGKYRVQVIAQHLQTFGEDFEIAQPEKTIEIKLKNPQGQFSVYGDRSTSTPSAPQSPSAAPKDNTQPH